MASPPFVSQFFHPASPDVQGADYIGALLETALHAHKSRLALAVAVSRALLRGEALSPMALRMRDHLIALACHYGSNLDGSPGDG